MATRYTLHAARRSGAVIAIVLSRGGREHGLGLSVVGAPWQVRGCTALLRLQPSVRGCGEQHEQQQHEHA
eukprot:scaffold2026_cov66-Phaeocystis_antarctica.AAC.4